MPERRAHAAALFWFVVANTALTFCNAYGYVAASDLEPWTVGWLFGHVALLDQVAAANLLIGGVLLAVVLVRGYAMAAALGPLLVTLLQLLVYVDRKIYALFHFHTNGLVLTVVSTAAGWDAIHMSAGEIALAVGGFVALLAAEWGCYRALLRRVRDRPPARPWRRWAAVTAAVAALVGIERLAFALCDLAGVREVTASVRHVPFYQRLSLRGFARRHAGIALQPLPPVLDAGAPAGALRYPREPLRFRTPPRPPNVVWIVVEGLRADVLTPEDMPETWALAARSHVFRNHLSGGNGTQHGIFSLFYGIHGFYWEHVVSERLSPLLLQRMKALGYAFRIVSSTSLEYGRFRQTTFADVLDQVSDALPGPTSAEKDALVVEEIEAFTAAVPGGRPFFAFLFLDSTHVPYVYPKEFLRHRPAMGPFYYKDVRREDRDLLFNRYRNAVAYADHLVGRAIGMLEARGLLDDTIVLVTGDHGEEFWEHGHWSHNSAFTPEQLRVACILHVPGHEHAEHTHPTSHQDVAPTFMELLGVENPASDYAHGHSLLEDRAVSYRVACGYGRCALVDGRGWVVFGAEPHNAYDVAVLDADYREVADARAVLDGRAGQLLVLAGEMSAFLR
jgi:hypothetical protein